MTRLRRTLLVALTAAAFIAGGFTMEAHAYQALPGANGSCNTGDFCGWRHDDRGCCIADTPIAIREYNPYGFYGTGIGINDQISSVRNRFQLYPVRLYQHQDYGGVSSCFQKNMASYVNVSSLIEDEGSSHRGRSSC